LSGVEGFVLFLCLHIELCGLAEGEAFFFLALGLDSV
jgi:hypothetical protein